MIVDRCGRATGNVLRIHESLFPNPVIDVKAVASMLDVTYAAANQLVGRLVRMRILKEITGGARNRKFRYEDYVNLFTVSR